MIYAVYHKIFDVSGSDVKKHELINLMALFFINIVLLGRFEEFLSIASSNGSAKECFFKKIILPDILNHKIDLQGHFFNNFCGKTLYDFLIANGFSSYCDAVNAENNDGFSVSFVTGIETGKSDDGPHFCTATGQSASEGGGSFFDNKAISAEACSSGGDNVVATNVLVAAATEDADDGCGSFCRFM